MKLILLSQLFLSIILIRYYKLLPSLLFVNNSTEIKSGGYFVFISIFIYLIINFNENHAVLENISQVFCLFFFMVGAIDDKFNLKPWLRIILIIFITFFLLEINNSLVLNFIVFGNDILILGNLYGYFFTIFCFLTIINALNFADGINCLAISLFLIIFNYLFLLSNIISLELFLILNFILIPLMYLNYKNKVFLGDGGIYLLSSLLAIFLIQAFKNDYRFFTSEKIFSLLFIPGLDMARLFFERIFKKTSPFKKDHNHIHHYLLKKLGNKNAVFIYILFLSLPIFLQILLNFNDTILLFTSILLYFILLFYAKN